MNRLLERGRISGRSDDNLESAKKRFTTYQEATLPIVDHYRKQGKVVQVAGNQSVEAVYSELRSALVCDLEKEVLQKNQLLLKALTANDWELYSSLCHDTLSAVEPSAGSNLIEGLDYHAFSFNHGCSLNSSGTQHIISEPQIRVMGRSAVVSYHRECRHTDPSKSYSVDETRIWESFHGEWK